MPNAGQSECGRALIPLLAWICGMTAVLSLRYGYYGNRRLILGLDSSRMVEASSAFVEQVRVKDVAEKGVILYGFSEQPELSLETNSTVSNRLLIDSYGRRGFFMWLNRGSKIRMAWEVDSANGGFGGDLLVVLIKGDNFEELKRYHMNSKIYAKDSGDGDREAEYDVDDDDSYYFGVVNLNPRSTVLTLKVNVSSKSYDTSKATDICSTSNGMCKISLRFPKTNYFVLTTSENDVPSAGRYVDISFTARLIVYFVVLGFVMVIVYMILEHLNACANERVIDDIPIETETAPILSRKDLPCTYGTIEDDREPSLRCSSGDLYDGKICAICYDEKRDCFFTPCGHNAICCTCAHRIMEEGNKLCPICRRLIHKARRLLTS